MTSLQTDREAHRHSAFPRDDSRRALIAGLLAAAFAVLSIVDRNADRLLRVVGDLLFVAQVDAGTLALEKQPA